MQAATATLSQQHLQQDAQAELRTPSPTKRSGIPAPSSFSSTSSQLSQWSSTSSLSSLSSSRRAAHYPLHTSSSLSPAVTTTTTTPSKLVATTPQKQQQAVTPLSSQFPSSRIPTPSRSRGGISPAPSRTTTATTTPVHGSATTDRLASTTTPLKRGVAVGIPAPGKPTTTNPVRATTPVQATNSPRARIAASTTGIPLSSSLSISPPGTTKIPTASSSSSTYLTPMILKSTGEARAGLGPPTTPSPAKQRGATSNTKPCPSSLVTPVKRTGIPMPTSSRSGSSKTTSPASFLSIAKVNPQQQQSRQQPQHRQQSSAFRTAVGRSSSNGSSTSETTRTSTPDRTTTAGDYDEVELLPALTADTEGMTLNECSTTDSESVHSAENANVTNLVFLSSLLSTTNSTSDPDGPDLNPDEEEDDNSQEVQFLQTVALRYTTIPVSKETNRVKSAFDEDDHECQENEYWPYEKKQNYGRRENASSSSPFGETVKQRQDNNDDLGRDRVVVEMVQTPNHSAPTPFSSPLSPFDEEEELATRIESRNNNKPGNRTTKDLMSHFELLAQRQAELDSTSAGRVVSNNDENEEEDVLAALNPSSSSSTPIHQDSEAVTMTAKFPSSSNVGVSSSPIHRNKGEVTPINARSMILSVAVTTIEEGDQEDDESTQARSVRSLMLAPSTDSIRTTDTAMYSIDEYHNKEFPLSATTERLWQEDSCINNNNNERRFEVVTPTSSPYKLMLAVSDEYEEEEEETEDNTASESAAATEPILPPCNNDEPPSEGISSSSPSIQKHISPPPSPTIQPSPKLVGSQHTLRRPSISPEQDVIFKDTVVSSLDPSNDSPSPIVSEALSVVPKKCNAGCCVIL